MSLFAEAESAAPRGAVILIHGIGVHPDWADDELVRHVVDWLRQLAAQG